VVVGRIKFLRKSRSKNFRRPPQNGCGSLRVRLKGKRLPQRARKCLFPTGAHRRTGQNRRNAGPNKKETNRQPKNEWGASPASPSGLAKQGWGRPGPGTDRGQGPRTRTGEHHRLQLVVDRSDARARDGRLPGPNHRVKHQPQAENVGVGGIFGVLPPTLTRFLYANALACVRAKARPHEFSVPIGTISKNGKSRYTATGWQPIPVMPSHEEMQALVEGPIIDPARVNRFERRGRDGRVITPAAGHLRVAGEPGHSPDGASSASSITGDSASRSSA
jgi:hypothetical protein